jgi:hypothetical protein
LGGIPWPIRVFVKPIVVRSIRKALYTQGIGRHQEDEILMLGMDDIKAISTFLGDKTYFFGEQITSIDAVLHAFLRNLYSIQPYNPLKEYIGKLPNLVNYIQRIDNLYWK